MPVTVRRAVAGEGFGLDAWGVGAVQVGLGADHGADEEQEREGNFGGVGLNPGGTHDLVGLQRPALRGAEGPGDGLEVRQVAPHGRPRTAAFEAEVADAEAGPDGKLAPKTCWATVTAGQGLGRDGLRRRGTAHPPGQSGR
jgi:hypothetical protein